MPKAGMSVVTEAQKKVAETAQRCGPCGRFFDRFCWGLGLGLPVVPLNLEDQGHQRRVEYNKTRSGTKRTPQVEWPTLGYVGLSADWPEEIWRAAVVDGDHIPDYALRKLFPPSKQKGGRPRKTRGLTAGWVTHTLDQYVEPWLQHLEELEGPLGDHVGEVFVEMPGWLVEALPDLNAFVESARRDYRRRPTAMRLLGLIPQYVDAAGDVHTGETRIEERRPPVSVELLRKLDPQGRSAARNIIWIRWQLDSDGGGEALVAVGEESEADGYKYVFDWLGRDDQIPRRVATAIRKDGRTEGEIRVP